MNSEQRRSLSLSDAIGLIKREMAVQQRGFIKDLCTSHNLTYHTVIGLLNDTLNFKAPELVGEILEALGYDVRITIDMISIAKEGTDKHEKWQKEITYYLKKKTSAPQRTEGNDSGGSAASPSRSTEENEKNGSKLHQSAKAGKLGKGAVVGGIELAMREGKASVARQSL